MRPMASQARSKGLVSRVQQWPGLASSIEDADGLKAPLCIQVLARFEKSGHVLLLCFSPRAGVDDRALAPSQERTHRAGHKESSDRPESQDEKCELGIDRRAPSRYLGAGASPAVDRIQVERCQSRLTLTSSGRASPRRAKGACPVDRRPIPVGSTHWSLAEIARNEARAVTTTGKDRGEASSAVPRRYPQQQHHEKRAWQQAAAEASLEPETCWDKQFGSNSGQIR